MQKLGKKLEQIRQSQKPGFMMHMVAGFPEMQSSERIAMQILKSGADLLEIQIPFSDPVADGPVIASANEVSLSRGATVSKCLELIRRVVASTDKPILIMTYFNIVHRYGVEAFCRKARDIGVQGLIIPDYPFDEETGNELIKICRENQLALIQVIASTTRPDRIRRIVQNASGFVYCMARTGITGKKTEVSAQTTDYLKSVREHCNLPIAVGFGLSERAQITALEPYVDIMVVGSALIKEYADKSLADGLRAIETFMGQLT